MIPSALVVAILAVATVVTSFISGILGMAGGMILMGVLLALLPVAAAMLVHGVVQLAANGWRALMLRDQIDWRIFRGYAAGSFVALGGFALVQFVVPKAVALLALGLMPFVGLALPQNLKLDVARRGHPFACGLVCGVLSLTAGVSGPILDVFFVRSEMSRQRVVATKAMTQALSHLLKVGYFGALADGTAVAPWVLAVLVLLALGGTSLSRRVLERISDADFRNWTRWTVGAIGAVYLVSGVRLMLA